MFSLVGLFASPGHTDFVGGSVRQAHTMETQEQVAATVESTDATATVDQEAATVESTDATATVDQEAATVQSTDEADTVPQDEPTVARPHLLSLCYLPEPHTPATLSDKFPTRPLHKRANESFVMGRGKDQTTGQNLDVLLNEKHMPRKFVELWCTTEEDSRPKWFLKNLSETKPVRMTLNGTRTTIRFNEVKEVQDGCQLKLEMLTFTVKIEEGDFVENAEFELEFLAVEDGSSGSSDPFHRQTSTSTDSSGSVTSAAELARRAFGSSPVSGQNGFHVPVNQFGHAIPGGGPIHPLGGGPVHPLSGSVHPLGGGPVHPLSGSVHPLGGGPIPPLSGSVHPLGGGPVPPLLGSVHPLAGPVHHGGVPVYPAAGPVVYYPAPSVPSFSGSGSHVPTCCPHHHHQQGSQQDWYSHYPNPNVCYHAGYGAPMNAAPLPDWQGSQPAAAGSQAPGSLNPYHVTSGGSFCFPGGPAPPPGSGHVPSGQTLGPSANTGPFSQQPFGQPTVPAGATETRQLAAAAAPVNGSSLVQTSVPGSSQPLSSQPPPHNQSTSTYHPFPPEQSVPANQPVSVNNGESANQPVSQHISANQPFDNQLYSASEPLWKYQFPTLFTQECQGNSGETLGQQLNQQQLLSSPLRGPLSMPPPNFNAPQTQHGPSSHGDGNGQAVRRPPAVIAQPESAALYGGPMHQPERAALYYTPGFQQRTTPPVMSTTTTVSTAPSLYYSPSGGLPAAPPVTQLSALTLGRPVQVTAPLPTEVATVSPANSLVHNSPAVSVASAGDVLLYASSEMASEPQQVRGIQSTGGNVARQGTNISPREANSGLQSRGGVFLSGDGSRGLAQALPAGLPMTANVSSPRQFPSAMAMSPEQIHSAPQLQQELRVGGFPRAGAPAAFSSLTDPSSNGNRVNLRLHERIAAAAPPSSDFSSDSSYSVQNLQGAAGGQQDSLGSTRQPQEDDERWPQENEEQS